MGCVVMRMGRKAICKRCEVGSSGFMLLADRFQMGRFETPATIALLWCETVRILVSEVEVGSPRGPALTKRGWDTPKSQMRKPGDPARFSAERHSLTFALYSPTV